MRLTKISPSNWTCTCYTESIFSDNFSIQLVSRPEMVNVMYDKLFRIFNVVIACNIIENWLCICRLTHIENDTIHKTILVTFSTMSPSNPYQML